MKKEQIGGMFFMLLFLMFVGLYFTASNGYYETEERKKTTLTQEQIQAFEKDVADGKKVDIENYLNLNKKDYDNQISSVTLAISEKIGKTFEKGLNSFFKAIERAMSQKQIDYFYLLIYDIFKKRNGEIKQWNSQQKYKQVIRYMK